MAPDWKTTKLWRLLDETGDRDPGHQASAARLRSRLELMMPDIVAVLASGDTAAADFTLHDEGHGFRVAERMVDVLTPAGAEQLSPTEASLLLLSAYLHDIGMTPKRGKVRAHREYLLTGAPILSDGERAELQRWLDDHADGLVPPLAKEITVHELRRADLLITHYARSRHNDWSAEWMREHLSSKAELYPGWLEDLVSLCRSHHYGYEELTKEKFDAKLVGPLDPPDLVHLRFLAAALRMADILEFDPERTPEVILQHRDVSPGSVLYWEKDHQVALIRRDKTLIFQARPSKAAIHRAIETMADEIDTELELCLRLKNENLFGSGSLGPLYPIQHEWTLEKMHRNITPRENTYEYVDGSFRPNTARILQLLSGTRLYSDARAAIRELIQNAFDAVQEKIAWQRLMQTNSASLDLERVLGDMNSVVIDVRREGDEVWLDCTDTGIGMTKNVLTNQFLISGSPRSHKLLDLERRCRAAGFELGRTGEFGIGALSYFMIADRVVIETRRSQEAGDLELNAWRFTTDGIGSFGELQKVERAPGTTVRLRLRREIARDLATWSKELAEYLDGNILHTPCRFELRFTGALVRSWSRGWAETPEVLTDRMLSRPESQNFGLISIAQRERLLAETKRAAEKIAIARGCLRWQFWELEIPDHLGRCRVALPIFELPQGPSVVFQWLNGEPPEYSVVHALDPAGGVRHGWKGMAAPLGPEDEPTVLGFLPGVFVTWNWVSRGAGQISISRRSLALSQTAEETVETVSAAIRSTIRTWIDENLPVSPLLTRSLRAVDAPLRPNVPIWWTANDGGALKQFDIVAQTFGSYVPFRTAFRWRGDEVPVVYEFFGTTNPPHFVVPGNRLGSCVGIWDFRDGNTERPIALPPAWRGVAGVILPSMIVGNPAHAAGRRIAGLVQSFREDQLTLSELVHDGEKDRLLAWYVRSAYFRNGDDWTAICETEPELASRVWEATAVGSDELVIWDAGDRELIRFTPSSAQVAKFNSPELDQIVPAVDDDWKVELIDPTD